MTITLYIDVHCASFLFITINLNNLVHCCYIIMEPQVVLIMILATMIPGAFSVSFTFENKCPYTVWPGILPNLGKPQLSTTGFELASGAPPQTVDSPADWAGRFWGRTRCTTTDGRLKCETADCASGEVGCNGAGAVPPATLAEITLKGNVNNDQDTYDISLVDGFNLPMGIAPQGGSCPSTTCAADVNSQCLDNLSVKGGDGSTIACKSACVAFNEPQYCCTGDYDGPDKCPPTMYSMRFKNACPQAYSYAKDDPSSTFTCPSGGNYVITFCP